MQSGEVGRTQADMGEVRSHRRGVMKSGGAFAVVRRTDKAEVVAHGLIKQRLKRGPSGGAAAGAAVEQPGGASAGAGFANQNALGGVGVHRKIGYRSHRAGDETVLVGRTREELADAETALSAGRAFRQSVPPRFAAVGKI